MRTARWRDLWVTMQVQVVKGTYGTKYMIYDSLGNKIGWCYKWELTFIKE